jgi:hypothetical protein
MPAPVFRFTLEPALQFEENAEGDTIVKAKEKSYLLLLFTMESNAPFASFVVKIFVGEGRKFFGCFTAEVLEILIAGGITARKFRGSAGTSVSYISPL